MTTKQFDPVFSAALRNELEALADAPEQEPTRPGAFDALRRPQVWISVVTAIVLVAATLGVLRITAPATEPAGSSRVVDPLQRITDPGSSEYVARAVQVLLHARGTGPGARDFDVPAGVTSVRVYLNCAPTGQSTVDVDGKGRMSGECSRDSGSTFDMPIRPGAHEVEVTVREGTDFTLLLMASPAPTISSGPLLDPLTAVRDRRNPDALTGDTRPLLRASGDRTSGVRTIQVPDDVRKLRVYLVCTPAAAAVRVDIDGHVAPGCMNSIAHWFDLTPTSRSITAEVISVSARPWSLLVVPAPSGAKDSPDGTLLPYPESPGTLLARARGVGRPYSGTYRNPDPSTAVRVTCRGTGWLEIQAGDSGTNTRGDRCSPKPRTIGFGGEKDTKPQHWSVIPHGDISWTFQLSTDD